MSLPHGSVKSQAGQRDRRKVIREEEEEEEEFLTASLFSLSQLLQSQDVKEDAVLCCSMEVGSTSPSALILTALPLLPLPMHASSSCWMFPDPAAVLPPCILE